MHSLVEYRANAKPEAFVDGGPVLPPAQCDVLMIWPTGDAIFCCEEQAKASKEFVKPPATFQ